MKEINSTEDWAGQRVQEIKKNKRVRYFCKQELYIIIIPN
jgi:hypothetical protein